MGLIFEAQMSAAEVICNSKYQIGGSIHEK
jgi:hypothetical protein